MATATVQATTNVTRLRDLKTSARDQLMIDPRIIVVEDGHNPRDYNLPENRAHLDELKASIKANGTINPLWVRFDTATKRAVLVDGECRLRANLELITEGTPIEAVPCIQVSGGNEADRLVLALTANTGKPLSKWESGTAFIRLVRFGWSQEKIAEKLGFSLRFVTEAIELADAPEQIKQLLSQQAITPSLALAEIRKNGANAVLILQQKAVEAQNNGGGQPAKREKVSNNFSLLRLVKELVDSLDMAEMADREFKFVEVDKKVLRKLIEAVKPAS